MLRNITHTLNRKRILSIGVNAFISKYFWMLFILGNLLSMQVAKNWAYIAVDSGNKKYWSTKFVISNLIATHMYFASMAL